MKKGKTKYNEIIESLSKIEKASHEKPEKTLKSRRSDLMSILEKMEKVNKKFIEKEIEVNELEAATEALKRMIKNKLHLRN